MREAVEATLRHLELPPQQRLHLLGDRPLGLLDPAEHGGLVNVIDAPDAGKGHALQKVHAQHRALARLQRPQRLLQGDAKGLAVPASQRFQLRIAAGRELVELVLGGGGGAARAHQAKCGSGRCRT